MRKLRKLRSLLLVVTALVVGTVTAILVGNLTRTKAANFTIEVTFEVYDYDTYMTDVSKFKYWDSDIRRMEAELGDTIANSDPGDVEDVFADVRTIDAEYTAVHTQAAKKKLAKYYNFLINGSDTTAISFADALAAYNNAKSNMLTEVTAGKNIIIIPVITVPDGCEMNNVDVGIDIRGLSAVSSATSGIFTGKLVQGISDDIKTGTNGDNYVYVESFDYQTDSGQTTGVAANHAYPTVGYATLGDTLTGRITLGAIATKVDGSLPNFTLDICNDYINSNRATDEAGGETVTFHSTPYPLTIEGSSSDVSEIEKVRYNGVDYSTTTSVTLNGQSYDCFTTAEATTTATSIALTVTTKRNGTLSDGTYNATSTSTTTATMSALALSGTGPYTINVTPTTWNAGETIYFKMTVYATDYDPDDSTKSGHKKDYLIAVPKEKYDDKSLTGLTVSSAASGGTAYDLYNSTNTATTTFASGTTVYYVRVPNNVTNVYVGANWDTTKKATVTINGNAYATTDIGTGLQVPFPTTANTQNVNIVVTSQKGNPQTYTVTLYRLSNDVSLDATNPIVVTDNAGHSNLNYYGVSAGVAGMTSSGNNYDITLDFGTTAFYVKAKLKDATKQKLEYSTDGTTYNTIANNTNIPQVAFASGSGTDTKTVYFKVTAEDGTTVSSPVYTVTVKRSGGSKDSIMPHATDPVYERYDGGAASSITIASTVVTAGESETGTYTKTSIPYKTKGIELKIPCKTTQTIKYRYGVDTTALTGGYTNSSNGSWTNVIYFNGASATSYGTTSATFIYVEVVITAQDSSSTSTYTFKYERLKASDDKNLGGLNIYLTETGHADTLIPTPTKDSTNTYTVTGDVDYKYNGVKVEPTFNTLATATVESATISAVAITSTHKSGEFGFSGTVQSTVTITLKITAEEGGSPAVYTIIVTRRAAEDDKKVTFTVYDGATVLGSYDGTTLSNMSQSGLEFTYTGTPLAFTTRYVTIEIAMASSTSKSKVKANLYSSAGATTGTNVEVSDGNLRNYYIDFDNAPTVTTANKTFAFTLYTEKNNVLGYDFKIKIERSPADGDSTIINTTSSPRLTGELDSQVYANNYNATTKTFPYTIVQSTSGTNYYLDLAATSSKARIFTSYTIPTPSSSIKIYDPTNFFAQFGTEYDPTSSIPTDHKFSAGAVGSTGQNLYVTIVAESGAYTTYVIAATYKDERQEGHKITNISITIANATSNTFTFTQVADTDDISTYEKNLGTIKVPFSTTTMQVYVTFDATTSNLASLAQGTQGTLTLAAGSVDYYYQARAENTTVGCVYKFTIERENASMGNSLEKLVVSGTTLVDMSGTADFNGAPLIYYAIPRTSAMSTIKFVVSDNAKYTYTVTGTTGSGTGTQSTSGADNTFSITGLTPGQKYSISLSVQSENDVFTSSSTVNPYTIEIYTAEQTYDIQNIELFRDSTKSNYILTKTNAQYAYDGTDQTLNVYYKDTATAYADVRLQTNSLNAVVTTDGTKTLTGGIINTYTIEVKSEYASLNSAITNQSKTILIKINRDAPSHDALLTNLVLTNETQSSLVLTFRDGSFSSSVDSYIVENIATNSSNLALVKFTPTLSDSKASYTITNADSSNIATLDGSLGGTVTTTVTITVTAEDGVTGKPYKVVISTGVVIASIDNTITDIIINPNNDSTTNIISFNPGNPTYTPTVRPVVTSVNITVTVSDHTASVYTTIDGGAEVERKNGTSGQQQTTFNVVLTNRPGDTTIEVICKAQDSTVAPKKYTITITSANPDQDRSFSTFKIETYDDSSVLIATNNYAGTTNPNIPLNVKNNVTSAKLTVVANSLYSTITPSNTGTPREYTTTKPLVVGVNTISFVITSEDNVPETYTITITRDDINTLSALVVNEVGSTTNLISSFAPNTINYPLSVNYSVDTLEFSYTLTSTTPANLTVSAKLRGSALSGNTLALNVGQNELEVIVTANSGDEQTYKVSITRLNGNDENFIITYRHDATQSFITDYDTTTSIGTYMSSANPIIYVLDRSYINQTYAPELTVSSTAKIYDGNPYKITQTNRTLSLGANNFTIIVTSETNIDNEYNFTIYVADSSIKIDSLNLYENGTTTVIKDTSDTAFSYNPDNNIYNLNYAYSQKLADLELVLDKGFASVEINGTGLSKGTNPKKYLSVLNIDNDKVDPVSNKITIVLTIKAELLTYYTPASGNYSQTITFQITKDAPNTDTSLTTLKVTAGAKTYDLIVGGVVQTNVDVTVQSNEFTLSNVGTISSYTITAVPTKLPTLTSIEQLTYNSSLKEASQNLPFTSTAQNASQSHIFTVYDEAHNTYTQYTIIVYRENAIDPDTNNDITLITVYDSLNKSYIDGSNFSSSKQTYTFGQDGINTISYGLNKTYTIVVTIPSGSLAKVFIDGTEYPTRQSGSIAITYPANGDNYEKTHTVYALSKSNDKGTEYTINVIAVVASADAFLKDLIVFNSTVPGFDKDTPLYSLSYDNGYDYINIYAEPNSSAASVRITNTKTAEIVADEYGYPSNHGDLSLQTGNNSISILVTAEDGKTTKYYTLNVFRDYADPYLDSLEVVGEKLLNSTYTTEVKFDNEEHTITHYYVKLLYGVKSFTVNAGLSVDNQTYSVVSNGLTVTNNTGSTRTFVANTKEGVNSYTITVRSPQGKSTKYTLTVKLNDAASASTNISVSIGSGLPGLSNIPTTITTDPQGNIITTIDPVASGIDQLPGVETDGKVFKPLSGIVADYSNGDVSQVYGPYVVANKVRALDATILGITPEKLKDADGDGAVVKVLGGDKLSIGSNKVAVQVTSEDGNNVRTVILDVVRLDNDYDMAIDEISSFKNDYANDDVKASYTVPANVKELNIAVTNKDTTDTEQPLVTVINGQLKAGENKVQVMVTPKDGSPSFTEEITVIRTPYDFEVSSTEIADIKQDYADDTIQTETYTVGSSVAKLNFSVINADKSASAEQPTYTLSNGGELKVGENNLVLTIESPDGQTIKKNIKVIREPYAYKVTSPEIAAVENDYNQGKLETTNYSVASKVSKISFAVANANSTDEAQQPVYSVSNGGLLKAGENNLVLTITSPDGTVTRKNITVTRANMEFTVNKTLNTFACEQVAGKNNFYTINLIDKTADAITDYKAYITFDAEKNDLVIEDLTGEKTAQTNEVLIRVSTADGAESEVVHFQLTSSKIGTSGAWFDILFWILLGIAIILLIIILVCVNRDKYGSISKKRKNA